MPANRVFRWLLLAILVGLPNLGFGQAVDVVGLNGRALDLINQGRPVEAEILARQAISVAEGLPAHGARDQRGFQLSIAQQRLGTALRLQGRFAEAELVLRQALDGADRHHGYASRLAIKTQLALGATVQAQGRTAEADALFRQALERVPPAKGIDELELRMDAQVRLGRLQVLNANHAEAERLLVEALRLSADVASSKQAKLGHEQYVLRWRMLALSGLAALSAQQQRYDAADAFFRQAAELGPVAWGAQNSNTMNAYADLASLLLRRDNPTQAETWSLRALEIADARAGELIGGATKAYRIHAEVLDAKGDKRAAETAYMRALELADARTPAEVLLHTLSSSAGFLSRNGRPEAAMPLYDRAVVLADRLFALSRGLDERGREARLERLRPIYGAAVANRVRLDARMPGQGHDRVALADVSRSQSRLFTEMLRTADVARLAGDQAFVELKQRRDDLLRRQDDLQRRFDLTARFDSTSEQFEPARPITDPFILQRWKQDVARQHRTLSDARIERESIEARLWRQYPRYMELEEPRPVSLEHLQRDLLRADERLLAYFRLHDQLLIFVVSRDDFQMLRVPVARAELDALVARARAPMEVGGNLKALAELDPALLHRLYGLLLEPVRAVLPEGARLLVIGDGPLYTLPLEMLVTRWSDVDRQGFEQARRADLSQYARLDYAGAHWRFSYAPSLAALAIQRAARPAEVHRRNLIAFADPVFASGDAAPTGATRALLAELGALRDGRVSIPRLPETADEVTAVAAILGGDNRLHLREAAQESRAKGDDLYGARYLHFATHGLLGGEFARLKDYVDEAASTGGTRNLVLEDAPDIGDKPALNGQPALVLTLVGDLQGEDGLLTMSEVMSLKMNPDLVVLSACNTAGERLEARNGEGFAGLTRAFMHAGARGLLVSHWSVESAATRDLVTDFFRRLQAGAPTPQALAGAQAALRVSRDAGLGLSRAHPFFWAPFVHVGE